MENGKIEQFACLLLYKVKHRITFMHSYQLDMIYFNYFSISTSVSYLFEIVLHIWQLYDTSDYILSRKEKIVGFLNQIVPEVNSSNLI